MQFRPLASLSLVLMLLLPACTGGSGSTNKFNAGACGTSGVNANFCLRSCSLGCVASGCQISEIAQNQPILLEFSQTVDPKSVSASSLSIKTANGEVPTGSFQVNGNTILFVPEIRVSGGRTRFGFGAGKTYLLSLPTDQSGSGVLRSTSGDPLVVGANCSMSVSQGIVDLNASPPQASLVTPTLETGVPSDSVIVVEFDELIDISPFRGATTETSPIGYEIRKTRIKPGTTDVIECDPNFDPLPLEGLPKAEINALTGKTTVTLKPSSPLPSQVCVQVNVSSRVRDLAGKAAEAKSFQFTTKIVSRGPAKIVETFASDGRLDKALSAGDWSNGSAKPPQIGGTGVHGSFEPGRGKLVEVRNGNTVVDRWFEWDTDNTKIGGDRTQSGQEETITDGVFHFTDFVIGQGIKVKFVGKSPAVINVRGLCQIDGTLEVSAPAVSGVFTGYNSNSKQEPGQVGGVGGPGGAAGGSGGQACDNKGAKTAYNGGNGGDVVLASGHAYAAQATGSGGRGTPLYPSSGKIGGGTDDYDGTDIFAAFSNAGGSGGGFMGAGTGGVVSSVPVKSATSKRKDSERKGPAAAVGKVFDITTLAPKTTSIGHYLVGGSGGGGAGSHPLMSASGDLWVAGGAGAGGGGALALRVGQTLAMRAGGLIESKGGAGGFYAGVTPSYTNVPAPGGGGSGGTILMQVGGTASLLGKLDVSGGKGGVLDNKGSTIVSIAKTVTTAGSGAPGYVRLETPVGPSASDLGITTPASSAKNVGKLTDADKVTATQSSFYSTGLTFPPTFTSYVLEARIDGKRRVYSDIDLSKTEKDYAGRAGISSPVWIRFQGATVSTVTNAPDLSSLGVWRDFVTNQGGVPSINSDKGVNGFRFLVRYDLTTTKTIELLSLTVNYTE